MTSQQPTSGGTEAPPSMSLIKGCFIVFVAVIVLAAGAFWWFFKQISPRTLDGEDVIVQQYTDQAVADGMPITFSVSSFGKGLSTKAIMSLGETDMQGLREGIEYAWDRSAALAKETSLPFSPEISANIDGVAVSALTLEDATTVERVIAASQGIFSSINVSSQNISLRSDPLTPDAIEEVFRRIPIAELGSRSLELSERDFQVTANLPRDDEHNITQDKFASDLGALAELGILLEDAQGFTGANSLRLNFNDASIKATLECLPLSGVDPQDAEAQAKDLMESVAKEQQWQVDLRLRCRNASATAAPPTS